MSGIFTNKTLNEYYDEIVEQVRYTTTHNSIKIGSLDYKFDYSLFFLFQKNIVNSESYPLVEKSIKLK